MRIIAISVTADAASSDKLAAGVSADSCGHGWRCPNPPNSHVVHHKAGSQAVFSRCAAGSPARQMSPMIWNGNHRPMMGTTQPQTAQARLRRCRQPRCSALIRARRNHTVNTMPSTRIVTLAALSSRKPMKLCRECQLPRWNTSVASLTADRGDDYCQQHGQDVRQPAERQEHRIRPGPDGAAAARAGTWAGRVAEAAGIARHVSFARSMASACRQGNGTWPLRAARWRSRFFVSPAGTPRTPGAREQHGAD